MLGLPTGEKALERLLQVDSAADVQDDQIMRAGFNDSGVARANPAISAVKPMILSGFLRS